MTHLALEVAFVAELKLKYLREKGIGIGVIFIKYQGPEIGKFLLIHKKPTMPAPIAQVIV
jgi:hypothetical protein